MLEKLKEVDVLDTREAVAAELQKILDRIPKGALLVQQVGIAALIRTAQDPQGHRQPAPLESGD